MSRLKFIFIGLFFFNLAINNTIHAQYVKEKKTTRILFIFDASNSMNGLWESGRKINIARKILINFIDSLEKIENEGQNINYPFLSQQCPLLSKSVF